MSFESNNNNAADREVIKANEAKLADSFRNGDIGTVSQMFNLYFDRLYSMVFYSVGRDRAVAEDITQDTFISALTSANHYKGNSSLYTWLVGIANHKIADYFRKLENDRKNVKSNSDISIFVESNSNDEVEKALEALPYNYRQVLLLKYVEEMTVSEICEVLHKTEKSVEALLLRGRKALRENINNEREKAK